MPVSIGTTTVTALFLGTTSISSAYLGNTQVFGGSFTPLSLFATGSQGIWLDPSDLTTMFSDRAGTTPVTTPGTVVGLRLDKSKGLVLGADTGTDFSSATGWSLASGISITGGALVFSGAAAGGSAQRTGGTLYTAGVTRVVTIVVTSLSGGTLNINTANAGFTVSAAGTYTARIMGVANNYLVIVAGTGTVTASIDNISVRELAGNHAVAPTDAARPIYGVEPKGGRRNLLLATDTLATQSLTVTAVEHVLSFTGTGTVTLTGASTAGPLVGTGAGNRVSLTFTPSAASLTLTVSGSVTLGQLELGSSATAYQKVVTAYNVTESGVATCHYVQYDGSDDSMSTAAIDFTGTDKMSVFAGVRKLSDAAAGIFAELSAGYGSNVGSFFVTAPEDASVNRYASASRGAASTNSAQAALVSSTGAAPDSAVITATHDIAGDLSTIRRNAVAGASGAGDKGTGNFGNYPLFIGRRNNASLPFNGKDYGLIVVGKAASGTEITDTETWLAAKTSGVSI